MVRLQKITSHLPENIRIYAKLERFNPGGSVKDRPALWMIREGLEKGLLKKGKIIIDSTSGNTGIALAMILLVPAFSSFSMRQVQELSITLSLSSVSLILLVITLLLGASSIWRDIEKRYTTSILTLQISRAAFLLSKFFSIYRIILLPCFT